MTIYELAHFCNEGHLADENTICQRIEDARKERKLTQIDLSYRLGINSDRTYRRWIYGLTVERVVKIAQVLDMDPNRLLLANPGPQ